MRPIITLLVFLMMSSLFAGENLTYKYQHLKQALKKHESYPLEDNLAVMLAKYHIIFVPGMMGQSVMKDSDQPIKLGFLLGEYYKDHMDWLNSIGISNERLMFETEDAPALNAKIIEKAILNAPKKVILITHSKGSIDSLEALIKNKSLHSKVKSWLALQSPFYGARMASILKKTPVLNDITDYVTLFLGGSFESVDALAQDSRKVYMSLARNKLAIRRITNKIKVISYYSTKANTRGLDTVLEPIRDILNVLEGKNDGLLEATSTILPGSNYIGESGVDHFLTVLNVRDLKRKKLWEYDRVKNLKAWLYLLL